MFNKVIFLCTLLVLLCATGLSIEKEQIVMPINLINQQFLNTQSTLKKNLLSPDMGIWLTGRVIYYFSSPQDTFSFDIAQALFDSSNFGLDADTCWLDNIVMEKYGDSIGGYYYDDPMFQFVYNHRYQFRTKGKGSIPPFSDTLRSPQNPLQVLNPHPGDTIIRCKDFVIQWVPYNEHNILIELVDEYDNVIFYYPVLDIGSFTIPATALESLVPGNISFLIVRENFKIEYYPMNFPMVAVSLVEYLMDLFLQHEPGIEQATTGSHQTKLFSPFGASYISYTFAEPQSIQLEIYDVRGRRIREITEPAKTMGTIYWDKKDENGNRVGKGIYFFILKTAQENYPGKFIIIKD